MAPLRLTTPLIACAGLLLACSSCGQDKPLDDTGKASGDESNGDEHAGGSGGSGGLEGAGADWSPLSALPDAEAPERPERETPDITSVEQAADAVARGFYDEAEAKLDELAKGDDAAQARLVRARLYLVTGRYDEAAQEAKRAAKKDALRVRATTTRAEALAARGELDAAQRAFESVAGEPEAHRARVLLGRLHQRRGEEQKAQQRFYELIDDYNDGTISLDDAEALAYVAMAAWGLDAFQDANEAFQKSTREDEDRVETQLEWARMFMEKYDTGHAEESVRHALERNPSHPVAHALMARIVIEQKFDFTGAEKAVARALEVNPNLVMAHVTRAGMALRDRDIDAADEHLETALEVDPKDLEALSVRTAVRYIDGADARFRRAKKAVLAVNPKFSEMFTIIAEFADWEHRYPDMIRMAKEALQIDPTDARAHALLGINLLRMGEEEKGLEALREAWRRDRYNVRVYNTLNLYDDVIPDEYEDFESDPFVFRMHQKERPILERYVPQTLERAYRDMKGRYGFRPEGPVRFELFADSEHFAVRTTGLPRLGVQGVCFGKVVTAISPGGGPFNWGQITWHELAHVFHIQLSENRVPRWFTEGLAEYEATIARPEWKREMDHMLWDALEADRLPPLKLMNRAFTHARSAEDMITAYYAATRIVFYIVDRFGFDKVVRMLREWSKDRSTPEVVKKALGVDIDTLDRDYRRHARQRLAPRYEDDFGVDFARYTDLQALKKAASDSPSDADAQAALAAGLLVSRKGEEAEKAAERALAEDSEQAVARFVLARIALAKGDAAGAGEHLKAILEAGKDGYQLRLLLARMAMGQKKPDDAKKHLKAATRLDPERGEAWQGLAMLAQKQNDTAAHIEALRKLVHIDEHGRQPMRALLPLLAEQERWQDLVRYGEMALFYDPLSAETHRLLAEGYLRTDVPGKALHELDTALLTEPEEPGPIHLARARALVALGERADAEKAAEEAVQADSELEAEAQRVLQP